MLSEYLWCIVILFSFHKRNCSFRFINSSRQSIQIGILISSVTWHHLFDIAIVVPYHLIINKIETFLIMAENKLSSLEPIKFISMHVSWKPFHQFFDVGWDIFFLKTKFYEESNSFRPALQWIHTYRLSWRRACLAHGVVLITETFIVRLTGQQPITQLT